MAPAPIEAVARFLNALAGSSIVNFEVISLKIAFRHAFGADNAKATGFIGHVQVGVKAQVRTVGVLHQHRLIINDAGVRVEHFVGGLPPTRPLSVHPRLFEVKVFGHEGASAAEARDSRRPAFDNALINIQIVHALLQQIASRQRLVSPPVFHKKGAVVRP